MTDYPSDADLVALTVASEAGGEIADGMAAVVRVILNRARLHYQSDGTIRGTILHPSAFSEFGFDWVPANGALKAKYVPSPDAYTPERVAKMLGRVQGSRVWTKCQAVVVSVEAGHYVGDKDYDRITDDTVLYSNLSLVHPIWATPAKFVAKVGRQSFYKG